MWILIISSIVLIAVISLIIYSSYAKTPAQKPNCPTKVDLCTRCRVPKNHCNCPRKNCEFC